MEDKLLQEITFIRKILSELIGTADLPTKEKFSKEAIAKAAKDYKDLSIKRGEWIQSHEISKVIKNAPYNPGKFIIEKFKFTNYFMRGKSHYFNKKDLIELGKELKVKNINLDKYMELVDDKDKFQKYIDSLTKGGKFRKPFLIPEGIRDIFTQPYSPPSEQLAINEKNALLDEYKKFDLAEYIDLYYDKTYAVFKYNYSFDRYLKPELKKLCKDWCYRFNYANTALSKIQEVKEEYNRIAKTTTNESVDEKTNNRFKELLA
jgi:hypothetical protein